MPTEKIQKLDLSLVDVDQFLQFLNIQNITHSDNDYRFSCPFPEHSFGDKSPSAYMNKNNTAWICFSCGRKGNAITFLSEIMGVSRTLARRWIAQKWSDHFVEVDDLRAYIEAIMDETGEEAPAPRIVIDEAELDKRRVSDWSQEASLTWGAYMHADRGFSREILDRFEVCYDPISDRPAITVRDNDGALVGFKGRAWRSDQIPKYLVLGDTERGVAMYGERYGFKPYDASQYVFALDKAVPQDGALIFCEGELNVISMHEKGFMNTIGPSGSTVSSTQIKKIVQACDEVIVFFDSDLQDQASAFNARLKIANVVDQLEPFVSVRVVPDHHGDPAEMERDQIVDLIQRSESSLELKMKQIMAM